MQFAIRTERRGELLSFKENAQLREQNRENFLGVYENFEMKII